MKLNRKALREIILAEMKTLLRESIPGDGVLDPDEAGELDALMGDAIQDAQSDGPGGGTFTSLPGDIREVLNLYYEWPDGYGWYGTNLENEEWKGLSQEPSYFEISDYLINMLQMNEFPGIDAEPMEIELGEADVRYEGPDAERAQMYHDKIADYTNVATGGYSDFVPDSDLGKLIMQFAAAMVSAIKGESEWSYDSHLLTAAEQSTAEMASREATIDWEDRQLTPEQRQG